MNYAKPVCAERPALMARAGYATAAELAGHGHDIGIGVHGVCTLVYTNHMVYILEYVLIYVHNLVPPVSCWCGFV